MLAVFHPTNVRQRAGKIDLLNRIEDVINRQDLVLCDNWETGIQDYERRCNKSGFHLLRFSVRNFLFVLLLIRGLHFFAKKIPTKQAETRFISWIVCCVTTSKLLASLSSAASTVLPARSP